MNDVTVDVLKNVVPKKYKKFIDEDIVDEINKLSNDIDYGEQFKEDFVTYANVLEHNANWSVTKYRDAIKFFSLTQQGTTILDSYCKVFPDRLAARMANGNSKGDMSGEASRYNSSELVNKIRQQALVPLHLVNQGLLQRAINETAKLMVSSRSDMVRQKAAETLIRELKAPESTKIELDIGIKSTDSIEELRKATEELVLAQMKSIEAGVAVKVIAESTIIDAEVEDE